LARLRDLELPQEQAEARHDEAEAHQRKRRADPREKRPLGRQVVAGTALRHDLVQALPVEGVRHDAL
jgi:hypothetical protein